MSDLIEVKWTLEGGIVRTTGVSVSELERCSTDAERQEVVNSSILEDIYYYTWEYEPGSEEKVLNAGVKV